MEEKLVQLRYMVITALFVNYKLSEDPIMRSTFDELLKPLVITELKNFMLLLAKTPREFRSVLELVSDVVDEIVKKRFDEEVQNKIVKDFEKKINALFSFAQEKIIHTSFNDEIEYLLSLDLSNFKEKDALLFSHQELYIITQIGSEKLFHLYNDDLFLFEKRIKDALMQYQLKTFAKNNLLSTQNKKKTLEDVNRPEIIETLADDKRF